VAGIQGYGTLILDYALKGFYAEAKALLDADKPEAIVKLLSTPSDDTRWEHERLVLLSEPIDPSVPAGPKWGDLQPNALLDKLLELEEQITASIETAKAKDDVRGAKVQADYADTHTLAPDDKFVKQSKAAFAQLQEGVSAINEALATAGLEAVTTITDEVDVSTPQVITADQIGSEGTTVDQILGSSRITVILPAGQPELTLADADLTTVILAAGKGSRAAELPMPKVIAPIDGVPAAARVINAAQRLGSKVVVIVRHEMAQVMETINAAVAEPPIYVVQGNAAGGTGNAVYHAAAVPGLLESQGKLLLTLADQGLFNETVFQPALDQLGASVKLVATSAVFEADPAAAHTGADGKGRIVRERLDDPASPILGIVEQRDAQAAGSTLVAGYPYTGDQILNIQEGNVSAYAAASVRQFFGWLGGVGNGNAQNQHYLTDTIHKARQDGFSAAGNTIPVWQADDVTVPEDVDRLTRLAREHGLTAGLEDVALPVSSAPTTTFASPSIRFTGVVSSPIATVTQLGERLSGFDRIPVAALPDGQQALIITEGALDMLPAIALLESPAGQPILLEVLARDADHQAGLESNLQVLGVQNFRVHNVQAQYAGREGEAVAALSMDHMVVGNNPITLWASTTLADLAELLGAVIPETVQRGIDAIRTNSNRFWA